MMNTPEHTLEDAPEGVQNPPLPGQDHGPDIEGRQAEVVQTAADVVAIGNVKKDMRPPAQVEQEERRAAEEKTFKESIGAAIDATLRPDSLVEKFVNLVRGEVRSNIGKGGMRGVFKSPRAQVLWARGSRLWGIVCSLHPEEFKQACQYGAELIGRQKNKKGFLEDGGFLRVETMLKARCDTLRNHHRT